MIFVISEDLGKIEKVEAKSFVALDVWERKHVQEWVRSHPEILGEDLLIVNMGFDKFEGSRVVGVVCLGQGLPEFLGDLFTGLPIEVLPLAIDGVGGLPPAVLALGEGPLPVAPSAHSALPKRGFARQPLSKRCQRPRWAEDGED